MKKYLFAICLSISIITPLFAQDNSCDCKSDLLYLNDKIEKLPSYKKNKSAYKEVFEKALNKASAQDSRYDCFIILNTLLVPLEDHHMGVIQNTSDSLNISKTSFPKYKDDLEDLKTKLKNKPQDDIEGVYHLGQKISIGLVYDEPENTYKAVILNNSQKEWSLGEILYQILPLPHQVYKVMGGQYPSKRLIGYHEKIKKGIFLRAGLKKDTLQTYYFKNPYLDQNFVFKELNPNTDYLKVGSFNSHYPLLKEAEDFYKELEGKLNKPNLILDLRDNGGGGDRNSNILFKQLKSFVKDNNIYILTNASTGSNAEQFTVKLMKYDNVVTFGDKTRGALSYEIKPNDYHTLPSSNFLVILPSKAHNKYSAFETKGINPDYSLDYNRNWIEQVQEYIESKN